MGYGNFQTGEFDEALNRLNNTKQINERDPFIGENDHDLMLISLEPFRHLTHGPSARASFEVLQSTAHPVGSRVTKLWFLTKPSKYVTQSNDSDRFADFVRNMMGAPSGYNVAPQCAALIRDRVNDQLMRGMIIKARGVNTSKNPAKPWVEVYWTPVAQAPDQIKARRAQIDAKIAAAPPVQQQAPQSQAQAMLPQQQYAPPYAGNPQGFGAPVPGQPGMYGGPAQQPNNPANYAQQFPPAQPMQSMPAPQQYIQQPQMQPPYVQQPQPTMMPAVQQPQWPPQVQAPQQPTQPGTAQPGPNGGLLSQIPGFNRNDIPF